MHILLLKYIEVKKWGLTYEQTFALKVTQNKLCETLHSAYSDINAIMGKKNKILCDIFYHAALVNDIAECRTISTLHELHNFSYH
uniref:Uncharacterized protein n=1 Tax=Onchocerca volvulus TaxID=6282 RepID=A0A8R1TWZ8_ONCVO